MASHIQGRLPLSPHLNDDAEEAFALDSLKTGTLISLAKLCDDDCIAIFNKYEVQIVKKDQIIIQGTRMPNGLWSIPISTKPQHQANGILRTDKVKNELATYHHATMGGPVPSTLLRAIRRSHLTTFPGLTTNLISKHLDKSVATSLGHQDQEAKNLRSTQLPNPALNKETVLPEQFDQDIAPTLATRTDQICALLVDKRELIKSYSDQTGRFPIPSSRGNNYLFILYHQDTNTIHAVAIPNRQAASIRDAWEDTHKVLVRQGHAPELHILDNECSADMRKAFEKYNIKFQRVPPHEHRVNAAERGIRTYKNHFVTILCNADSNFPITEWDRLLAQTTLTLNLLRSSRIHPSLSAHASLFGNFDFNRTPMAPPGTKVVAHETSDNRASFAQHGKVGWYIGPSPEHYRCWKCYFEDTMKERDVLKVDFFPEKIPFPKFEREEYLRQTAEDMLHLLTPDKKSPLLAPLEFGPPVLNAFAKVAKILGRAMSPPDPPSAPIVLPTIQEVIPPAPVAIAPRVPPLVIPNVPANLRPPRVDQETPRPSTTFPAPVAAPRVPASTAKVNDVPHHTSSTTRLRASPRFNAAYKHRLNSRRSARVHLAQSVQHDPTIAGKMYNPDTGKAETIDTLLNGPDGTIWTHSLTNEWGRCTRGLTKNRTKESTIIGQQTMVFIKPHEVPHGRKVTYANFVCTMRPGKSEVYRIRMTVGGDRLEAYQDVRSPAVGIIDTKLHLNSTISDASSGARYCTADIKDFFLGSTMKVFQYMRIHRRYVPQAIIDEYELTDSDFDAKGYI
jgi:hypothetical protein